MLVRPGESLPDRLEIRALKDERAWPLLTVVDGRWSLQYSRVWIDRVAIDSEPPPITSAEAKARRAPDDLFIQQFVVHAYSAAQGRLTDAFGDLKPEFRIPDDVINDPRRSRVGFILEIRSAEQ